MIPLFDDNSDRRSFPVVNYLFIALNIFVFIMYQQFGHNLAFTYSFATVPAEILTGHDIVTASTTAHDPVTGQLITLPGLGVTPVPVWVTLITSMFLHGGVAHLAGNMLYLWIFGDNLEDKMGHLNYFFFYLLCGVIASLTLVLTNFLIGENLLTPSIGASGAISGVMGGYLLLFPTKRVTVLLLIFFVRVPAYLVLGLWILLQVASGTGYLGGGKESSIAYAAHIGGFFAGLLLVKRYIPKNRR